MKKEQDLLVNYINNVLFHPEDADINLALLSEEYRELGEKVKCLGEWALEADRFAGEVAAGKIERALIPDPENVFANNIINLQSILRHMTQQIERIIDQSSNYKREEELIEGNFDAMVRELHKRTSALENERNLFIQFTESASERIVVLGEETGEVLFGNKVAREYREQIKEYVDDAFTLNRESGCSVDNPYSQWTHTVTHPDELGEPVTEIFHVHSIYIIWENQGAIAHMFSDVTTQRKMENLAMKDCLTGAFNRSYAMEYMNLIYEGGKDFSIAFVDVDYLKYCNDTFGHAAGDDYLIEIVEILEHLDEGCTVCRTGGDEFLVVSENLTSDQLAGLLEHTRRILGMNYFDKEKTISKSFSYGVSARTAEDERTLQILLSEADERMYQDKLENKRRRHMAIQDDRMV
ncbi:MAG: GGDEF domain-containing protein [Lachnospiraceae bacterium]|nr:GGDEF domain-containing protein [Lachnospiraceae bacterium]